MAEDKSVPGSFIEAVPDGDTRQRLVCAECGFIQYDNPKVVVGAICLWEDQILLCRRAIKPRPGYWTLPAGFMELNETMAEGAAREVMEEAEARVQVGRLIGIYEIPRIGHVHVFHMAQMISGDCSPGVESQEVRLFAWDDIPWDDLAFPSVKWALERFQEASDTVAQHRAADSVRL